MQEFDHEENWQRGCHSVERQMVASKIYIPNKTHAEVSLWGKVSIKEMSCPKSNTDQFLLF